MTELVQIEFHGDPLWATRQDGEVFVAMRPVCEGIGLAWNSQFERIHRDSVLNEGVRMMRIPSRGGVQEALCLPLRLLNGWLFGIDERRLKKAAVRQKIIQYKRECYAVLFDHFMPRALPEKVEPEMAKDEWGVWLEVIREGRRVFGQRFAKQLWSRDDCPLPKQSALEMGEPSVKGFLKVLPGLPEMLSGDPWVGATDLYQRYLSWCQEEGLSPVSQTKFGRSIAGGGVCREMKAGRIHYAVRDFAGKQTQH